MTILEKIFGPVIKFFGILASSLTGMSAVFTAIGFLAERSRLVMLGFTDIPVDLNQYLYTGTKFFGYLPFIFVSSTTLNFFTLLKKPLFLLYSIILILLVLIWWLLSKFNWMKRFNQGVGERFKSSIVSVRSLLLLTLVLFQFAGIFQLFTALEIENMLYFQPPEPSSMESFPFRIKDTNELQAFIAQKNIVALMEYFGLLLFMAATSAFVLWSLMKTSPERKDAETTFGQKFLIVINLILFSTQLIMVPINFGILIMPNRYPTVKVVLEKSATGEVDIALDKPLILLNHQAGDMYLYSPDKEKVWFVKEKDVKLLEYRQMEDIFELK